MATFGSWFAKSNLTLAKILNLTYYWLHSYIQVQTQFELHISSISSVDWYMFAREVCKNDVIYHSVPIGGPGKRVQIDETKVGKHKFNQGREMDCQCVFGGREEFDQKKIFIVCVDRQHRDPFLPYHPALDPSMQCHYQ